MRKYEYQVISLDADNIEKQLNALGTEGWRVVQVMNTEASQARVLLERDAGPRFHDIRSAAAHG